MSSWIAHNLVDWLLSTTGPKYTNRGGRESQAVPSEGGFNSQHLLPRRTVFFLNLILRVSPKQAASNELVGYEL